MLIISQDPNNLIPAISERDIHNKIVLAKIASRSSYLYLDMAYKEDGKFCWKGHSLSNRHPDFGVTIAERSSLIELLCVTWREYQDAVIKFYILDNWHEVYQVLSDWKAGVP
jgi:hypothetical protein